MIANGDWRLWERCGPGDFPKRLPSHSRRELHPQWLALCHCSPGWGRPRQLRSLVKLCWYGFSTEQLLARADCYDRGMLELPLD
jgi:hypothetical protein